VKATIIHAPRDIRVEEVPDPAILAPRDAIVRVVAACVCGSDLWPYRGIRDPHGPRPMGHELVGVVEELGAEAGATGLAVGDVVISPFTMNDGSCQSCRAGVSSACDHRAGFGGTDHDGHPVGGAQAERVRIPMADATLVRVPGEVDDALIPDLLALSDVMSTGHHAAHYAGVGPDTTVVVVGDGAVGLSAVLAAARLGARRIIAMSRHAERQAIAREFGATDIVEERGEAGIAAVRELLGGDLADAALECVGTAESMDQAIGSVRGGGRIGYVGVLAERSDLDLNKLFWKDLTIGGGIAAARSYLPELLDDVLAGRIHPGRVFDLELPLDEAAEAYAAMDERRAIKSLLRVSPLAGGAEGARA
jgi:threonine dehydrogenase-like Zn-dependent dehydrogenase